MIKQIQNIVMHAAIAVWIECGMYYIDFMPFLADEIDLRRATERLKTEKNMLMPTEILFVSMSSGFFDRYLDPMQYEANIPREVEEYCADMINYLYCSMHKTYDIPNIHYELRHMAMAIMNEYEVIIADITTSDEDSKEATIDWIERYEQLVDFYKGVLPT